MGDCHVYVNHMSELEIQLKRTPRPFPTLKIIGDVKDIDDFTSENFKLENYNPHPKINLPMAV